MSFVEFNFVIDYFDMHLWNLIWMQVNRMKKGHAMSFLNV